jgi:hypothetical protein
MESMSKEPRYLLERSPTKDVVDLKTKTIAAAEVNKNPIKKNPTTIGCTYPF